MTEITILIENYAKEGFVHEHGLSFAIKQNDKRLLFDVGASDNFLINANKLNIDISEYKNVVLSHSHWDHTNGLKYLNNKNLIAHQDLFDPIYSKRTDEYIGVPLKMEEAKKKFSLELSKTPIEIFDDVIFLGEIPRTNNFESQEAYYYDENKNDDFVLNDTALAILKNNSIIIVTGCSHSGIVNIMNYAKEVCEIDRIKAVIGGFHLRKLDSLAIGTIKHLKNEEDCIFYPMHCTSNEVVDYMTSHIGSNRVSRKVTGDSISFK